MSVEFIHTRVVHLQPKYGIGGMTGWTDQRLRPPEMGFEMKEDLLLVQHQRIAVWT